MCVHLDTDLGGDPDDACALAMLLGWREVRVVGITTAIDPDGERAGCVAHCLELAGHPGIPLVAGVSRSLSTGRLARPAVDDERYWPRCPRPAPAPLGAAVELLAESIACGATVIAIGPLTNLALLELSRPGSLERASVVVMGGWVEPPAEGLPAWGPEKDFNVQWDSRAAEIVFAQADLTLVPLPVTLRAHLRARDLPRLRASGPLGELLADQSQARCADAGMEELARAHPGLPDDLVNFHYDPLACAVALGWHGVTLETALLRAVTETYGLRFERDCAGRPIRVVVDVDGDAFAETWIEAVEAAQRSR